MSFQYPSDYPALILLTTLIGFAVLVMGRQILWVFIAGLGFVLGLYLSGQIYNFEFGWEAILVSTLIALVGAVLAYSVQRFAAGIAGFGTGWYVSIIVLDYVNINLGSFAIAIPVIVGIITSILLIFYYDWGVIIASSLAGSAIVVSGMSISRTAELVMFFMLAIIGIVIQTIWFLQEK
jgi:hypothetical protein